MLFLTMSHAQGISHSRVFHMMLTKCRSPNTTQESFKIDFISQQHHAWSTFIFDKSNGFTRPGVERIKAKFPDVFDKNMLPYVESDAIVRAWPWNYTPMRFWQNQLNFAVWCATTGCGTTLALQDLQNPRLYSTYTIKSAASCLSSKHHCRRHNRGMPLIMHSTQNPMNKSAQNST